MSFIWNDVSAGQDIAGVDSQQLQDNIDTVDDTKCVSDQTTNNDPVNIGDDGANNPGAQAAYNSVQNASQHISNEIAHNPANLVGNRSGNQTAYFTNVW